MGQTLRNCMLGGVAAVSLAPMSHAALFADDAAWAYSAVVDERSGLERWSSSVDATNPDIDLKVEQALAERALGERALAEQTLPHWSLDDIVSGAAGGERLQSIEQWGFMIPATAGGSVVPLELTSTNAGGAATPVPLPATLCLFGSALAAWTAALRCRRSTPIDSSFEQASASGVVR